VEEIIAGDLNLQHTSNPCPLLLPTLFLPTINSLHRGVAGFPRQGDYVLSFEKTLFWMLLSVSNDFIGEREG